MVHVSILNVVAQTVTPQTGTLQLLVMMAHADTVLKGALTLRPLTIAQVRLKTMVHAFSSLAGALTLRPLTTALELLSTMVHADMIASVALTPKLLIMITKLTWTTVHAHTELSLADAKVPQQSTTTLWQTQMMDHATSGLSPGAMIPTPTTSTLTQLFSLSQTHASTMLRDVPTRWP